MPRKVKVKGIRRGEIDTQKLLSALWIMSARVVEEQREREAKAKAASEEASHEG